LKAASSSVATQLTGLLPNQQFYCPAINLMNDITDYKGIY